VKLEIARPVPPRLAEIAPASTEFPTPSLTSPRRPATSDTEPTSNRTTPPKWVSILPTTSTRRTSGAPGKNCAENDALESPAHLAHSGRTYTYTVYSNGHRKAPKSENAYKLLLHKVYMLRKGWNCGFGDLLTPPSFTASSLVARTRPSTRSSSVV
jgi:hypothetical protein